jgi:RNA polymerase sigma factor (sigma-70 family)
MTTTDPLSLLPTRRSLLSRLKDWDNQDSWREFFNTYWRLIYGVARKAGLDEAEAEDVVQDTLASVAKEMKNFRYDKSKGSFKGWLKLITRRRVSDALRKRYRAGCANSVSSDHPAVQAELAGLEEDGAECVENVWEDEWKQRLLEAAIERVKNRVSPAQFQIFELYALSQLPIGAVTRSLGVSIVAVHVANHRVKKLLKAEIKLLEAAGE